MTNSFVRATIAKPKLHSLQFPLKLQKCSSRLTADWYVFFPVAQVFAGREQQCRAQVVLAQAHGPRAGDSSRESLPAWDPGSGDYCRLIPCREASDMDSISSVSLPGEKDK